MTTDQKSRLPQWPAWLLRLLPKLDIQTRVKFNNLTEQQQKNIMSRLENLRSQLEKEGKSTFEIERSIQDTLVQEITSSSKA